MLVRFSLSITHPLGHAPIRTAAFSPESEKAPFLLNGAFAYGQLASAGKFNSLGALGIRSRRGAAGWRRCLDCNCPGRSLPLAARNQCNHPKCSELSPFVP